MRINTTNSQKHLSTKSSTEINRQIQRKFGHVQTE